MTLIVIVIIFFLLGLSAYFSACETAITAVSRGKMHHLSKMGNKKASTIIELHAQLGNVISVLLTFNTMLNAIAVSLATGLLISLIGTEGMAFASLLMGILILIYAEVMPKMLALNKSDKLLLFSAKFLYFIFNLLKSFNTLVSFIARVSLRFLGFKVVSQESLYPSIDEVRGVIDLHQGPGQDVPHERAMLKSILDLGSVQLNEIIVHRKNVTMINIEEPIQTIVDKVLSSPFSRLPLWEKDPENIVGVIHAKALLRYVKHHEGSLEKLSIRDIASSPWFVPESTDLLEQLLAFRKKREHFSIVVDEYGSLMGIVTLEDILEEIVGDITDEHDIAARGLRPQKDGSIIIDGNVTIRDLNREFDWNLPDENAATLAGLLLHYFRMIPDVGQVFILSDFRFEVLRRQRNQITLIHVRKLPPQAN